MMSPTERDLYFMAIAEVASQRSTCDRASVGAVLVEGRKIRATGYNGSPRSLPHCRDQGCAMVGGHCVRTTHAEVNALIQGVSGDKLYTTSFPCLQCCNMIINHGIVSVFYRKEYLDERFKEVWPNIDHPKQYLIAAGLFVHGI